MVNMKTMPLTARHIWITAVASLGQLIGTGVATLVGIVIPMINIIRHPELSAFMQGLLGSMDLIGIAVGSVLFGKLSDRYGYLFFFRFCPAMVLVAALISIFIPSIPVLVVCLFFIGLGIGGEYSLDSDYISELMPEKYRSLMIGVSKAASAFGNIIIAAMSFWLLSDWRSAESWPKLMWIVAVIAALMVVVRIRFYQSPVWLIEKGRDAEAEKAVREFLGPDVSIDTPAPDPSPAPTHGNSPKMSFGRFFKGNIKQIILSGIPWACEGLGVYGIGIFLPILVMALGIESSGAGAPPIDHIISSVEITLWISCIILPGFIIGLILIRKDYYIPGIQTMGFALCGAALVVLLFAYRLKWDSWIAIGAFMAFELFLNIGPHLVTYVLPPKIYPVSVRGLGSGLAASIGKIGAVIGVFLIPLLLKWGGATLVLIVSAAVMVVGAVVTGVFGPQVLPRQKSE